MQEASNTLQRQTWQQKITAEYYNPSSISHDKQQITLSIPVMT